MYSFVRIITSGIKMKTDKIVSKSFTELFIACIITGIVRSFTAAVMAGYAINVLGATVSLAGTMASFVSFGSVAMMIFCGPLGNRVDARRLIAASTILYIISSAGYIWIKSVPLLIICRALTGCGNALFSSASLIMVYRIVPKEKLSQGVAYYGIANQAIQFLGPGIALKIQDASGFSMVFIVSFIASVVSLVIALVLPSTAPENTIDTAQEFASERKAGSNRLLDGIICREAWIPAALGFLFPMTYGMQHSLLAVYADSLGLSAYAPLYFLAECIVMIYAKLVIIKYFRNRSYKAVLIYSTVLLIAFSLIMGLFSSPFSLIVSGILFGLGYGILNPVLQTLAVSLAPEDRKGSGSSTYFLCVYASHFIAPVIGSFIADPGKLNMGYQMSFAFLVIPCVIGFILGMFNYRELDERLGVSSARSRQ